jgi:hypothetical protein
MGTWSQPIFVNPNGLVFNKTENNVNLFNELSNHCDYHDNHDENNNSLDYIHSKISDYAKIYGYFTEKYIKFWSNLLKEISKQNNHLENIELHFYCSDECVCFIIGLFGGEFKIIKSDRNDLRWTVITNCPKDKKCDDECDYCDGLIVDFSKEKYISYMEGFGNSHKNKLEIIFYHDIQSEINVFNLITNTKKW